MKPSYESFKQAFVEYFSSKGYKTYVSKRDKDLVFMYSSSNDISVIELFNTAEQPEENTIELNRLIKKLAKIKEVKPEQIKVKLLYFDPNAKDQIRTIDNVSEIVSNNVDYFKNKLQPDFADSSSINVSASNSSSNVEYKKIKSTTRISKEDIDDLSDIETPEQLQQKANQFALAMKASQGIIPVVMLLAFLVVPLIGTIVSLVWNVNGYDLGISRIFQGGSTYDLTILGGQAWRIFSYGLSTPDSNFIISIIVILIAGWSMYNMSKLNSFIMKGWKFFLAFLIAYIITGYFGSVLMSNFTIGGVLPILGIVTGMLALNTSGSKSLVSSVSKMKLIWPIVLIIIFPIFDGGQVGMEYAISIAGFAIGGAVALMFSYDYKNTSWTIVLPIFVLLVAILAPSIMLAVPSYVPGTNNDVIITLALYVKKGIITSTHANNIISNIGWDNISIDYNNASGILTFPYL